MPPLVHQQLLGDDLGVPCLGEGILHRLPFLFLLSVHDLPCQRQHDVVTVVPIGGQPVLGQFALNRQGALQLLGYQFEGVGLEGAPVGHEHDLDGPGLADAP